MIKLKSPLLWDGHLIPTGKSVALPELLEKNIVSAGNGEYVIPETKTEPENNEPPVTAEMLDLAKRVEALKLNLPDDSTVEQVREAVETAEQEQQISPPDIQTADDAELQLGRVGRKQ